MLGVNRGEKIAGGRGSRSLPLDFIKRHSGFGSGHFFGFGGENFIQNIGHGAVGAQTGKADYKAYGGATKEWRGRLK